MNDRDAKGRIPVPLDWLKRAGFEPKRTGELPFPSREVTAEERLAELQVERESAAEAPTLPTRTWSELEALAEAEPTRDLVVGLIPEGACVLVYGYGAVGKSFFVQELALSVHRGKQFLGYFTTQARRVGIIDEESAPRMLGARLHALRLGHEADS